MAAPETHGHHATRAAKRNTEGKMDPHLENYLKWLQRRVAADCPHLKLARRHYARFLKNRLPRHRRYAWKAVHLAAAEAGRPKKGPAR
jgi:hypothetical protein